MCEIPPSSYYKIGKLILEKSYEKNEENDKKDFLSNVSILYDSSISYMTSKSDRLNSSSFLFVKESSLKFESYNDWCLLDKFIDQQTTDNTRCSTN